MAFCIARGVSAEADGSEGNLTEEGKPQRTGGTRRGTKEEREGKRRAARTPNIEHRTLNGMDGVDRADGVDGRFAPKIARENGSFFLAKAFQNG